MNAYYVTLVRNRFFVITSLFFVIDRKEEYFGISDFFTCAYMQIFNFRDGHMTTFPLHSEAYICQMTDSPD